MCGRDDDRDRFMSLLDGQVQLGSSGLGRVQAATGFERTGLDGLRPDQGSCHGGPDGRS